MESKKEFIISGEIVSHPITIFSKLHEGEFTMGFTYKVRYTQIVNYEIKEVELWITSVYDLRTWDVIKMGDKVELSVLKKQKSTYSDTGFSLKCNIVSRKR